VQQRNAIEHAPEKRPVGLRIGSELQQAIQDKSVYGRHGNARGARISGLSRYAMRIPEPIAGEIFALTFRGKYNLRQHPVGPLAAKKRREFVAGLAVIGARITERNKPGIPIPLMRVQGRGRFGKGAENIAS